jgi:hypothetical protein
VVVGQGRTRLDAAIERVARVEGRRIDRGDRGAAFLHRQDGIVLLERGVPTVMVNSSFYADAPLAAFLDSHYHAPSDELANLPHWDSLTADARLNVALVRHFADSRRWRRTGGQGAGGARPEGVAERPPTG